jgi:alpha-tubulin suppressor-like RCC1 family protein
VKSIALGENHACALLAGGAVKCWGKGSEGQLGGAAVPFVGTAASDMGANLPSLSLGAPATDVFAFDDATCVALSNGKLRCFGELPAFLVSEMTFPTTVKKLVYSAKNGPYDADAMHACALLSDQSLRCWGSNTWGAVGLPAAINSVVYDPAQGAASLPPIEIP